MGTENDHEQRRQAFAQTLFAGRKSAPALPDEVLSDPHAADLALAYGENAERGAFAQSLAAAMAQRAPVFVLPDTDTDDDDTPTDQGESP